MLTRCLATLLLSVLAPLAFAASPKAGETPPDALGVDREGNAVHVGDFRGRPLVVTFWASWCHYCLKEMPVLEALQQKAGGRLQVVAINFREDKREYRALLRKLGKVALLMTHDTGPVSEAYGVDTLPNLFLIDAEGKVAFTLNGYDEKSLPGLVDRINGLMRDAEIASAGMAQRSP